MSRGLKWAEQINILDEGMVIIKLGYINLDIVRTFLPSDIKNCHGIFLIILVL